MVKENLNRDPKTNMISPMLQLRRRVNELLDYSEGKRVDPIHHHREVDDEMDEQLDRLTIAAFIIPMSEYRSGLVKKLEIPVRRERSKEYADNTYIDVER